MVPGFFSTFFKPTWSAPVRAAIYARVSATDQKCGMQLAELRESVSPVIGNQRANTWIQLERDNGQLAGNLTG